MRVIYHPDAEAELIGAARFYEDQVPTLGGQFLDVADHAVRLLQAAPERFRVVEDDIRRFIMNRFPYSIYYRLLPGELRILAICHQSRHPDYWRYRRAD
ncbi:MAG: type II toxin-antitoxin system RelE/ParE family toxin [Verrucomicrobiota bacterium]